MQHVLIYIPEEDLIKGTRIKLTYALPRHLLKNNPAAIHIFGKGAYQAEHYLTTEIACISRFDILRLDFKGLTEAGWESIIEVSKKAALEKI